LTPPARSDRQNPNVTLFVLGLAGLVYSVVLSSVLPALPSLQHSLHVSVNGSSWILTTYLLAASVATPIIGRLGDMYGKERLLVWTLAGLAVGTALAALSNSIVLLDVARVIQGAGGGIVPLSFGIVRDEFPRERVAGSIGLLASMLGIGGGIGIVLAGVILEHLSWQWLFWIPLIPTLAAMVLAYFFVPESPVRTPAKVNWLAALLMAVGISTLLLAISEATSWGWASPRTLGLLGAGVLVSAGWILWELRSTVPLVDMRMMRLRSVWTTNLVATLIGGPSYALFVIVPQFVQEPRSTGYGLGSSVLASALFLLPFSVTMLLMSLQAGRIARRFGSKAALLAGALASASGFAALLVAHTQPIDFYAALGLSGLGLGLAYSALGNLIVDAVPRTQTGVASGVNAVMRTLGGALGTAVVATLIASETRNGRPLEHGFMLAFAVSAGLLVISMAAGLLIPGRRAQHAELGLEVAVETALEHV
jgi:EmrB/QacA subfamily drug resistance transporter